MNEFSFVKEVIDQWDPFDLLAMYCPEDEYDDEIRDIVNILPKVKNEEELANEINRILYTAFNEDFKKLEDCIMVAIKIFKLLK